MSENCEEFREMQIMLELCFAQVDIFIISSDHVISKSTQFLC